MLPKNSQSCPKPFHGCLSIVAEFLRELPQLFKTRTEPAVCIEGSVESVRGQNRLARLTAFFRVFIISCFRDPPGNFAFRELKMKTNHCRRGIRFVSHSQVFARGPNEEMKSFDSILILIRAILQIRG